MSIIYLTVAFLLNSIANILLKFAAKQGLVLSGFSVKTIADNIPLLLGFTFFAMNVIFYFLALRSVPVSVAYPVMVVMSLTIISTFSFVYFHEHINITQMVGYGFLLLGLVLIFFFSSNT